MTSKLECVNRKKLRWGRLLPDTFDENEPGFQEAEETVRLRNTLLCNLLSSLQFMSQHIVDKCIVPEFRPDSEASRQGYIRDVGGVLSDADAGLRLLRSVDCYDPSHNQLANAVEGLIGRIRESVKVYVEQESVPARIAVMTNLKLILSQVVEEVQKLIEPA